MTPLATGPRIRPRRESVETGILAGAMSRGIGRRQIEAKNANEKADKATDKRGSKITKTLE